jgi:hypothetical protein
MSERLCIVRRDRQDLFEEMCREFKDAPDVKVIFDRRIGERRRTTLARVSDNRRRSDRRRYRSELRLLGWMLTRHEASAMPLTEARPA